MVTSSTETSVDAIVIGAGPNGLAAAITLARAGRSVRVYEAAPEAGGGTRTMELTLPGFRHDMCSTILSLATASPFFRTVDLAARGVELIHPDAPIAHPLDGGRAVVLERSVAATARELGEADGRAWARLLGPLVRDVDKLSPEILQPVIHLPRHPLALARFGLPALRSARGLARSRFHEESARALFGGIAAHAMLDLDRPLTASFGLVLATYAHAAGWPMVRGGAAVVAAALVAELEAAGGEVVVDHRVDAAGRSAAGPRRAVRHGAAPAGCDRRRSAADARATTSRALPLRVGRVQAGLGARWAGAVGGAGARRAATVHLGGTLDEIATAEADVAAGRHPDRPYVLFVQYAPWDPSRGPEGKTTAWAYCHVPAGSDVDMTDRIEAQVERFAPGFRDRILARSVHGPAAMAAHDANYIGGDINGGIQDIRQLIFRPWPALDPYRVGRRACTCARHRRHPVAGSTA